MEARGYPVGDFEQRVADISVDHAGVVHHYRAAHRIAMVNAEGAAETEDLRQAMKHYRALFEDLLEVRDEEPRQREACDDEHAASARQAEHRGSRRRGRRVP